MNPDEVLRLLDYPVYFDLLNFPLPENRSGIMDALAGDDLIRQCDAGGWDILNLGAILLAKGLNDFPRLGRKSMRVIRYSGDGRIESATERSHDKGYAAGIRGVTSHIDDLLPSREVIEGVLRRTVFAYPSLAVRELVANALIHQDFTVTGAGPMVEIFDSRVEITNPGEPPIDKLRLVDMHPRSCDEARQMRRAARETRRLKTWLGRVVRDIERKGPTPAADLRELLPLAKRLLAQQRQDSGKLYSVHAPEVECIAKGKAHKRYEFGCKVSLAIPSKGTGWWRRRVFWGILTTGIRWKEPWHRSNG